MVASVDSIAQVCTYCEGDTPLTLTAACSGGTGITYTWESPSNVVTNGSTASANEAGTWTWVCMDANGCSTTGTYDVIIEPDPMFSINAIDICTGTAQTITATGVPSGYTYSWTFPSGTPSSSTTASTSVTWNTAGTYVISATIDNGTCTWTETQSITVGSLTGSATCN